MLSLDLDPLASASAVAGIPGTFTVPGRGTLKNTQQKEIYLSKVQVLSENLEIICYTWVFIQLYHNGEFIKDREVMLNIYLFNYFMHSSDC